MSAQSTRTTDLLSIGMSFEKWQDAVEAAIASGTLAVTGEVRGGQLVQFADPSGAQLNILAVEPFATFAGFESETQTFAHINMVNDVLALCELVDYNGQPIATVTANLAQGPLLVDEPEQGWQQLGLTALVTSAKAYENAENFHENFGPDIVIGEVTSPGAEIVASGDGSATPDAEIHFTARVLEAEYRTNTLTGTRFIHATVDAAFPFDLCIPDSPDLPQRDQVLAGTAVLAGTVSALAGGGCGSGSGGCGGSCGCGGH
ncbi:hypothetical protein NQ024_05710 [Corynebacterium sp. 35RC1]|nr:hypothetical protein [Corynebacterium sp. 35RC1]